MSLSTLSSWVESTISRAVSRNRAALGVGSVLAVVAVHQYSQMTARQRARARAQATVVLPKNIGTGGKKKRVAVDLRFFTKVYRLLKILIPSPACPEVGYIVLVTTTMLLRTYCDLWMLTNGTAIERAIITRNTAEFRKHFSAFLFAMAPISIVNNLLKYGLNELKMRFRSRLTNSLYDSYLDGFTYYQVSNIDARIANPDQLLTQDVDRFCVSVAELYSNISKPLVDMFIYARALTSTIGAQGPMSMLGYLIVSGVVLTRLRRPTGRYTVREQELEGEFRFVNSRLITHAEEIAFYDGHRREKNIITSKFDDLIDHIRRSQQFRAVIGFVDSIIAKYCATAVGFLVLSRPYLLAGPSHLDTMTDSEIMEDYYRNGRMLINLAKAMGRLVLAGRELTRLAGFTERVTELQAVLRDLHKGKYVRTMVDSTPEEGDRVLVPYSGEIIDRDRVIEFVDVPLVTPNGDVLVKNMNFKVESGMNVLVCGPNGCGKSSLFRILGGLWPIFGGTVIKPTKPGQLFYVPQRPYLALGTLRDQVTYPHNYEDMVAAGSTDEDLLDLLRQVHLAYLVDREGGWDAVEDWQDVLSGGEKQRVAMARLFYHKPQFAILDECTSAVSVDVEGFMYNHCRENLGVTLFTVSHRKSLWRYHDYVLRFDGQGNYSFERIDQETEIFGS